MSCVDRLKCNKLYVINSKTKIMVTQLQVFAEYICNVSNSDREFEREGARHGI